MQQKLLTSPPWDWWWKTLHTQVQECLPMCRPLTSQSVCDTWTHSPVQRSPRITCGLLTVRAKSLNPAGEIVSEYASFIGSSLHILYVGVSHGELSIFQCGFQAIYSFCILSTVYCHSCPCLCRMLCVAQWSITLSWRGTRSICSWRSVRARLFLHRLACEWPANPAGTACLCGVLHTHKIQISKHL